VFDNRPVKNTRRADYNREAADNCLVDRNLAVDNYRAVRNPAEADNSRFGNCPEEENRPVEYNLKGEEIHHHYWEEENREAADILVRSCKISSC
jgi:hypothetical protein